MPLDLIRGFLVSREIMATLSFGVSIGNSVISEMAMLDFEVKRHKGINFLRIN